jgi:hypothetical protein
MFAGILVLLSQRYRWSAPARPVRSLYRILRPQLYLTPTRKGRISAEAYKDVIHEDAIRIGGTRKFFVEAKLQLRKFLAGANTPNEKAALRRQIAATDGQIDQLVYELYGLTEDEIQIVEEATRTP